MGKFTHVLFNDFKGYGLPTKGYELPTISDINDAHKRFIPITAMTDMETVVEFPRSGYTYTLQRESFLRGDIYYVKLYKSESNKVFQIQLWSDPEVHVSTYVYTCTDNKIERIA